MCEMVAGMFVQNLIDFTRVLYKHLNENKYECELKQNIERRSARGGR